MSLTGNIRANSSIVSPNVAPIIASVAHGFRPRRIIKVVFVPECTRVSGVLTAPITGLRGDTVENTDESGGVVVAALTRVSAVDSDDIAGIDFGLAVVGGGPMFARANSVAVDEQFECVVASEVHVHLNLVRRAQARSQGYESHEKREFW